MENKTNEEKLVEYIQQVLSILSIMTTFVDHVFKICNWYTKGVETFPFKFRDSQIEILEFLKNEYGIEYTILDLSEKKE